MRRLIWSFLAMMIIGQVAMAISPNDILPPQKLRPGMKGYGLTVFRGTKIERFPITVIGVLEKMDFDMDAILVRIDGGTIVKRKTGIIMGMSGSPIFVNGKLIGAIAFAWSFAKEPIAGVTPITAMLASTDPKKFPSPRFATGSLRPKDAPLFVSGQRINRVWVVKNYKEAEVMRERLRSDEGMLVPVATPLLVRGVPRAVLPLIKRMLEPYNFMVLEGAGGTTSLPVKDAPIKPGSALGIQLIGGDVDLTAVGTVTWVDGDKILGLGHSMFDLGMVDVPFTSAYVVDIASSQVFSFKLAVSLKEKGRLTQDRMFAVAGELGKFARTVPMKVSLSDFARRLQRRYNLKLMSHKEFIGTVAYTGLLGALLTNISPSEEGSTYMRLRVEAKDLPPIVRENWFANEGGGMGGIIFILLGGARTSPIAELADVLEAAVNNRFEEVKFTRIAADIEFYPQRRTAWIDRITARKSRVKPGEKVPVALTLKGWGGFERTITIDLEVPANARPGRMRFLVGGGMMGEMVRQQSGYRRPRPRSLNDLWEQLQDVYANNEVLTATSPLTSGVEIASKRWESLPSAVAEALMSIGSSDIVPIRDYREKRFSFDRILTGLASISLTVETDEREKEGLPRLPVFEPTRPPAGPPEGEPPPPPPGGEEDEASLMTVWQRLAALPIAQQWRDPVERAWSEIQVMKRKWEESSSIVPIKSYLPFLTVDFERMQREEKLEKEQPPQPPDWEEVRQLSPEQAERKEQPTQPPQPPQPSARTQPIARQPKTWVLEKGDDWLKGKLDGTIVTTAGTVTLGYQTQTLYEPAETIGTFCLLPEKDGRIYVGTVSPARVLSLDVQGNKTVLAEVGEEVTVTALALSQDGTLWFATAPNGFVFRLPKGADKLQRLCQLNATVWAIAFFNDGTAVLSTGPEGKVFTVWTGCTGQEASEPKLLVQLPERHAIALAEAPDGSIYVGTNPRGKVYRLSQDGKVTPIFECPQNPVQSLAVDGKGNLFVGTSGAAIVYLVRPDGRWRELRRFTPERHIMALFGQDEGVLVATGSPGKVYRLTPDGVSAWLYDSKQPNLIAVAQVSDAICTISSSGEVILLERNREGAYQSPILDTGQVARWGVIRFVAEVPKGAQLILQTRSGNTAYPDKTWSDWNAGYVASGQSIDSPPARYLRLRVLMRANEKGEAPVVKRVGVVYLPKNQPPKLTIQEPAAGAMVSGKVTIRWKGEDPDKDRLVFEAFCSTDGKAWEQIREAPVAPERKPSEQKSDEEKSEEKLSEEKPAEEKPAGEKQEARKPPAATTRTSIQWDTTKVTDGIYFLKIIASDRVANPDDPQTAEQIVAPIIVDNTPPVASWQTAKRDDDKLLVPCYDNNVVASAEYRAEGGEWVATVCQDGVFDQSYEVLVIDLTKLPKGVKTIELRVRDAAGNERTEKFPSS